MILIDRRKGSIEFFEAQSGESNNDASSTDGVLRDTDIPAMLYTLRSGDFAFDGNGPNGASYTIAIELKSLYDLVTSRTCGRLQGTQIRLMNATYDVRYLVYYGAYRVSRDGYIMLPYYDRESRRNDWRAYFVGQQKIRHAYLEGILAGLEEKGIRVKHFAGGLQGFDKTTTMTQISFWIAERYRWWNRDYESHTSMNGLDRSRVISKESLEASGLTKKELVCANIANSVPGIGTSKAIAMAKYFRGSSVDMHLASVEEIAEIEARTNSSKRKTQKIGKVTAKNFEEWTK